MIIIIYNFIFSENEKNGLKKIMKIEVIIIGAITEEIIDKITIIREETIREVIREEIKDIIKEITIIENRDIRKIIIKIDLKIILKILHPNL